jgi:hypothetical protein
MSISSRKARKRSLMLAAVTGVRPQRLGDLLLAVLAEVEVAAAADG